MNTNTSLIRILAFGDSNTWGQVPGSDNALRYPSNIRWTGVLQSLLGENYEVIEEGLNGRTTNINSPDKSGKNGKEYLLPCLESQMPIDIIILALGTNDLKIKYNRTPEEIVKGSEECLEICELESKDDNNNPSKIVMVSPEIIEEMKRERFGKTEVDFEGAKDKSIKLAPLLKELAIKHNAIFIDTTKELLVSKIDGIHLEHDEHRKLAELIFKVIKQII